MCKLWPRLHWCLKERVNEHRYTVRTGNMNNGIAAHAWNNDHHVDWEAAKVRLQEHRKRKVLECYSHTEGGEDINLDIGLSINPIWTPILNSPTQAAKQVPTKSVGQEIHWHYPNDWALCYLISQWTRLSRGICCLFKCLWQGPRSLIS